MPMRIQLKVIPKAKREEVRQEGDLLVVRVKEPPKEGKANSAVVKVVAKHFGVSSGAVRIVSGYASRSKVVEITKPD